MLYARVGDDAVDLEGCVLRGVVLPVGRIDVDDDLRVAHSLNVMPPMLRTSQSAAATSRPLMRARSCSASGRRVASSLVTHPFTRTDCRARHAVVRASTIAPAF